MHVKELYLYYLKNYIINLDVDIILIYSNPELTRLFKTIKDVGLYGIFKLFHMLMLNDNMMVGSNCGFTTCPMWRYELLTLWLSRPNSNCQNQSHLMV
jgi:hypothetical protein